MKMNSKNAELELLEEHPDEYRKSDPKCHVGDEELFFDEKF